MTEIDSQLITYIDNKFAEIERLLARETATIRELDKQHSSYHAREHEMVQLAVDKAERTINARLETMNEFRAALTEQSATMVRRDFLDSALAQMSKNIEERIKTTDTAGIGRANTVTVQLERLELEMNRRFDDAEKSRKEIAATVAVQENKWSNLEGRMYMITGIMGAIVVVITLINAFVSSMR